MRGWCDYAVVFIAGALAIYAAPDGWSTVSYVGVACLVGGLVASLLSLEMWIEERSRRQR
jgi:hypothetical protein